MGVAIEKITPSGKIGPSLALKHVSARCMQRRSQRLSFQERLIEGQGKPLRALILNTPVGRHDVMASGCDEGIGKAGGKLLRLTPSCLPAAFTGVKKDEHWCNA